MIRQLFALFLVLVATAVSYGQNALYDSFEQVLLTELPPLPQVEQSQALTLSDLEAIAFQNNPSLAVAAARSDAARGRQLQSGLYPNPVVGYHATEIGNLGTAGQQGGFISQRFITGGKLALDQAIAGKEIDAAHFEFHGQEKRVLSDVRVRFHAAHLAQRRIELTEELARIGTALVRATEQLVDARQGTENDLLQAEIRADDSQILRDNARNQHSESWRRLVAVIGVPFMEVTPLVGELGDELPNCDWDSCRATVLGNNPELNAALARVERANIVVRRARVEPVPNIDLSVSLRHHNVTSDDVVNVQAGFPIPLFDKNQGNIRKARAEWVAACNEAKLIELNLQDRLATAYRRYANAYQQVDRYRTRMVPKAKRSLELVTRGYDTGQVEFLTVLSAQQTYVQVSLAYLDSLLELHTAYSVIDAQLLTDGLTVH